MVINLKSVFSHKNKVFPLRLVLLIFCPVAFSWIPTQNATKSDPDMNFETQKQSIFDFRVGKVHFEMGTN